MLRQIDELRRRLESACRESQDRRAEAMVAREVELRAIEQVTSSEQQLDAVKSHMAETKTELSKSLQTLEVE